MRGSIQSRNKYCKGCHEKKIEGKLKKKDTQSNQLLVVKIILTVRAIAWTATEQIISSRDITLEYE
jgi:hypothetical protein